MNIANISKDTVSIIKLLSKDLRVLNKHQLKRVVQNILDKLDLPS